MLLDGPSPGTESLLQQLEGPLIDFLDSHLEQLEDPLLEGGQLSDGVHEFSDLPDPVAGPALSIHGSLLGIQFGHDEPLMESQRVALNAISGGLSHLFIKL